MPPLSGKHQPPHPGDAHPLQRDAASLQRRACRAHIIHEQNPLPFQMRIGAPKGSADIVSPEASTETYLRNSASHAYQGIPSEGQTKSPRHFRGEECCLVVSSFLQSPGVKRYGNDDICR